MRRSQDPRRASARPGLAATRSATHPVEHGGAPIPSSAARPTENGGLRRGPPTPADASAPPRTTRCTVARVKTGLCRRAAGVPRGSRSRGCGRSTASRRVYRHVGRRWCCAAYGPGLVAVLGGAAGPGPVRAPTVFAAVDVALCQAGGGRPACGLTTRRPSPSSMSLACRCATPTAVSFDRHSGLAVTTCLSPTHRLGPGRGPARPRTGPHRPRSQVLTCGTLSRLLREPPFIEARRGGSARRSRRCCGPSRGRLSLRSVGRPGPGRRGLLVAVPPGAALL